MAEEVRTDVVVVGAGMAGLVAGLRAAETGADVVVLEKGDRPGGSMILSFGFVWTYESMDPVRERIPHGNETLQERVVDGFDRGLEWLEALDITMDPIEHNLPGIGRQIDPAEFTETVTERIRAEGGNLRLRTPMNEIRSDDTGTVTGVIAENASGERIEIEAESVILATGGFQGNEELVEKHITDHTENVWLRANPWSTGDGLLSAKDVGAKTTMGMNTFYAHNLLAPPARFSNEDLGAVSQYYGPKTIALDQNGERYTDESESDIEETLAQDTATKADGRAYYVLDETLYHSESLSGQPIGKTLERIEKFDGRIAKASTIQELCDQLAEWGVNGDRAVETIDRFNQAVREERGAELSPPRMRHQEPVDSPPFYAVPVQPGLTFTMGGLAVNNEMEVLNRATTGSDFVTRTSNPPSDLRSPLHNLFAAGTDIGNVHHRRYLGGLATALVTGLIAGENAATV